MANMNRYNWLLYRLITQLIYAKRLKKIGKKSVLFHPMQIDNPQNIEIGDNVFIAYNMWLMGGQGSLEEASLKIGDNTTIGHYCHLVANHSIRIGRDVLLADKVFISDCTHEYEDIDKPITQQPLKNLKSVSIGDSSWIGENVCIQGASIGRHCIIGSNSVVIKDIPDYSVAVGAPAKVVKKYSFETKTWEKSFDIESKS